VVVENNPGRQLVQILLLEAATEVEYVPAGQAVQLAELEEPKTTE